MSISQNTALYAVLGMRFGGSGSNFNLPDLRGRLPMGTGTGPGLTPRQIGEQFGQEGTSDMPAHSHTLAASTATTGLTQTPAQNWTLGAPGTANRPAVAVDLYGQAAGSVNSAPTSTAGSATSVSLLNPALVLNFCIALSGLFPSAQ